MTCNFRKYTLIVQAQSSNTNMTKFWVTDLYTHFSITEITWKPDPTKNSLFSQQAYKELSYTIAAENLNYRFSVCHGKNEESLHTKSCFQQIVTEEVSYL